MKKILITGSTGFTARYLIPFLQQFPEIELIGLDVKSSGLVREYEVDLLKADHINLFLAEEKPDVVIHLAAVTKCDDYKLYYEANVFAVINLLESVVRNKLLDTRLLLISSSAVYGKSPQRLLSENSALYPVNFYGNSKLAMEQVALQYFRNYNLPLNIVRPFNIVGAGQPSYFVVPAFAEQLLQIKYQKREPIISVGNLSPYRDFIDIHDVVHAYWLILNSEMRGEIFNVGSSVPIQIEAMLFKLIELLNIEVSVRFDESRHRPIDIPEQIADISKIKSLGWQPTVSFEDSLKNMLADMQDKQ